MEISFKARQKHIEEKKKTTNGVMRQKSNRTRMLSLMIKQNMDSFRSCAQRTERGDETDEFYAKIGKMQ